VLRRLPFCRRVSFFSGHQQLFFIPLLRVLSSLSASQPTAPALFSNKHNSDFPLLIVFLLFKLKKKKKKKKKTQGPNGVSPPEVARQGKREEAAAARERSGS
jgi:hypothetical protein